MSTEAPRAGDVLDVVVEHLAPFGAFVGAGSHRGLINIPEISWRRISHPAEALSVGQTVRVRVLRINHRDNTFRDSLRALHPEENPWRYPSVFAVGNEFTGVVERVLNYGVFVELFEGERGLVRAEPGKPLPVVGQRIRVRVSAVNVEQRRVELAWLGHAAPSYDEGGSAPFPAR